MEDVIKGERPVARDDVQLLVRVVTWVGQSHCALRKHWDYCDNSIVRPRLFVVLLAAGGHVPDRRSAGHVPDRRWVARAWRANCHSASTVGDLLERQGLTQPKRRRPTHPHPGAVSLVADTPNAVWSTDFRGQFRTGDGQYCFPLTVTDNYSRFLLGCHGLPSIE